VRLLLDQNLSPRLLLTLGPSFAQSSHVREHGLERAADERIWQFAIEHEFAIVSKDVDFQQMSFLRGHPSKVIWLRVGNRRTAYLAELVARRTEEIREFLDDRDAAFLSLG